MLKIVKSWVDKFFSDEEAVILFFLMVAGVLIVAWIGQVMAPVIASIVIAFILQGVVGKLSRWGLKPQSSVVLTYLLFLSVFSVCIFALFPLFWGKWLPLVKELPRMFTNVQDLIRLLPERYPQFFRNNWSISCWLKWPTKVRNTVSWFYQLPCAVFLMWWPL